MKHLVLVFLLVSATSHSQEGMIIADSTYLWFGDSLGKGDVRVLRFGEQVSLVDYPSQWVVWRTRMVKIKISADVTGWVRSEDIVGEVSDGTIPTYISDDTVRLLQTPSPNSAISRTVPNNFFSDGDYRFIFPTDVEYVGEFLGWNQVRIDKDEGWIAQEYLVPSSFLCFVDSNGVETGILATPEIGVLRLEPEGETNPGGFFVMGHTSISWLDLETRRFEKRFHVLGSLSYVAGKKSFLVNQWIRDRRPNHTENRLFWFRRQSNLFQNVTAIAGPTWPPLRVYTPPNQTTVYTLQERAGVFTLSKCDQELNVIDSMHISEIVLGQTLRFMGNDTLVSVLSKRGDVQEKVICLIDLVRMKRIYEKDISAFIEDKPFYLEFENVFTHRQYLFLCGRFTLKGEHARRFRVVRINLLTDELVDVPVLADIAWMYTPWVIQENQMILQRHLQDGSECIQEIDLESLKPTKSIQMSIKRRGRMHFEKGDLHYIVGGEGSGLYTDGILKLKNGGYVLLYSIHKD